MLLRITFWMQWDYMGFNHSKDIVSNFLKKLDPSFLSEKSPFEPTVGKRVWPKFWAVTISTVCWTFSNFIWSLLYRESWLPDGLYISIVYSIKVLLATASSIFNEVRLIDEVFVLLLLFLPFRIIFFAKFSSLIFPTTNWLQLTIFCTSFCSFFSNMGRFTSFHFSSFSLQLLFSKKVLSPTPCSSHRAIYLWSRLSTEWWWRSPC